LAGLVGLADRVRSKWGIYRSIKDSADLANTYLLLTDMKAYRWQ
jgi:chitin-binding protein